MEENNKIQVISADGEFLSEEVNEALDRWNFKQFGTDYKALAILGCQSGGKSTLLNLLFRTSFETMDFARGRQQTTQGIWLSKADVPNILVFDVEGTDSKERGEDEVAFERKTSLFSLALSEILLVNLWFTDIGRLQASNLGLLKIVLELNLQLFASSRKHKTLLLFCIRDWDKKTPSSALEEQMTKDLNRIWSELQKPEKFSSSVIGDFFELKFVALPHFVYCEDDFRTEVGKLRDRFVNPSNPGYLWDPQYKAEDAPADGFSVYISHIWETIKENKDLDLPTQREMLAMYRCDEISSEVYRTFTSNISSLQDQLRGGVLVEDFGPTSTAFVTSAVDEYWETASRYHREVATKKGEELVEKMKKDLHTMFLDLIAKLRNNCVDMFEENLAEVLPANESAVMEDFGPTMRAIKTKILDCFTERAEASIIEQAAGEWKYETDRVDLMKTLDKKIQVERENQMRKMQNYMQKKVKLNIIEPILELMDLGEQTMWENIRKKYSANTVSILEDFANRLECFECTEEEIAKQKKLMMENIREQIVKCTKQRSSSGELMRCMMDKFNDNFKNDEKGLPRKWEKGMDIPTIYSEAYKKTEVMVDLFAIIRLDEEYADVSFRDEEMDIPPEYVLLSRRECSQIVQQFKRATEIIFSSARAEQDRIAVATQIPTFVLLLLLILGYDDIWWMLTNPFLFSLFLVCGSIAFGIWYLGIWVHLQPIVTPLLSYSVGSAIATIKHIYAPEKPKQD